MLHGKSRATMEAMDEVIDEKRTLIKLWVGSYNELVDGGWKNKNTWILEGERLPMSQDVPLNWVVMELV